MLSLPLWAFEIYDGKKVEVEMELLLGFEAYYKATLLPGIGGFELSNCQIKLEGEYLDKHEFVISSDLSEIEIDDETLSFLKDAYTQHNIHDFFRIRAGKQKVPFGEEISMGTTSRQYISHSEGSDLIAPGRSLGLSFSGDDILTYFGYETGLFNDSGEDLLDNDTGNLMFTGQVNFEYKFLETTYSILYSTEETFAHGISVDLNFNLKDNVELRVFSEFLEQRYYNYYWNHSLFTFAALRINSIEPVLYLDYYNEYVGGDGSEDKLIPGIGFNKYFNNRIKLMIDLHTNYYYSLEDLYNDKFYDSKVTIKLIMELE
jgi:hypothetical protein